jgi:hypothetical protein
MSKYCISHRLNLACFDAVADEPLRGRPYGVLPSHRRVDHDDHGCGGSRDPGFEEDQSGWVGQSGEDRVEVEAVKRPLICVEFRGVPLDL